MITDSLTGLDPNKLINRTARLAVLGDVLSRLKRKTDEPVTQVLITDLAVQ